MARNKLDDLNNHLFMQIERLTDESGEFDIDDEANRSKALSSLASQVIGISTLKLNAAKLVANCANTMDLPEAFGSKNIENKPKEE